MLVGYLAAVSRKLDEPLAVLIQSASAAGKTALMDALLAMVPADERVLYSAVTGQALFYLGETDPAHKLLAIAEDEGVARAGYALKLLQSEGVLTIASTGKDPRPAHDPDVSGPGAGDAAADDDSTRAGRGAPQSLPRADRGRGPRPDPGDPSSAAGERQTLAGLLAERDRARVRKLHQDAQRLLRPLLVVNPYARALTLRDDRTRTRRDHLKYLTLIRALAMLHQHQRPLKRIVHHGEGVEYVEVTVDDIAVANRLAHEVLGRSLDELAPQTLSKVKRDAEILAGVQRHLSQLQLVDEALAPTAAMDEHVLRGDQPVEMGPDLEVRPGGFPVPVGLALAGPSLGWSVTASHPDWASKEWPLLDYSFDWKDVIDSVWGPPSAVSAVRLSGRK